FRGAAFETRQNRSRLTERQERKQAAGRILRERTDGHVKRRRHGEPGEHREEIVRRDREQRQDQSRDKQRAEVPIQQKRRRNPGTSFSEIRDPRLGRADSFAQNDRGHKQREGRAATGTSVLQSLDRKAMAI